jgi:CHAT domain-containing protein
MSALSAVDSVALVHDNFGHVWFDLGDLDKAAHHFHVAVQTYQEIGALFPAARSLVQTALVETHQGRSLEALGNLQEARRVCEATKAHGYLAICDQVAGEIQAHIGNHTQALYLLGGAEAAFTSLGMPINALACRITEADIRLVLSEHEQAERLYQDCLTRAEVSWPDLAWRCAAGLAHIAEQRGRLEEMLSWHRRVVRAMNQARRGLHHERLVATFLTGRLAALNDAIAAATKSGQPDTALSFVEESRAQRLAFRLTNPYQPIDPNANDELRALRRQLAELRHKLSASLDSDASWSIIRPTTIEQQSLLRELADKALQYEQITMRRDTEDATADADQLLFNLSGLRHALSAAAPTGWTSLAYYWLGATLLIFVIDAESLEVYTRHLQPLDQTALELCTSPEEDRRRQIYSVDLQPNTAQKRASAIYLKRLHDLLIPSSLYARFSPSHLLVIVPAGPLHALPFHTLTDGTTYLCEHVTIAYAPSLAHIDSCLRQVKRLQTQIQSALIVAVEDFDGAMPPLPQAGREAKLVQAFFPRPKVLQDALATPEAVSEVLRSGHSENYHIVHFATHGVFEAAFGRLSRLVLYRGDLQADEIEQIPLNARLVVLSACQSALGQVYLGEEAIGLTQAFFAVGVPSVLSPLWTVEDKVAPAFMADFYENLIQRRLSPAVALTTTQRKWIAEGKSAHDWAAFGFYGAP